MNMTPVLIILLLFTIPAFADEPEDISCDPNSCTISVKAVETGEPWVYIRSENQVVEVYCEGPRTVYHHDGPVWCLKIGKIKTYTLNDPIKKKVTEIKAAE